MNLIHLPRAEEVPDNEGWIMKRRKNDRKENNTNAKPKKVSLPEKKGALTVVDLTEKAENTNNSNKPLAADNENKTEKIRFTQILRDRIDGKFSDEDLRLLLVKVLSKPGQIKYHIGDDELHTPLPSEPNNNNTREPETHTVQEDVVIDQEHDASSSSSSDDDYASDHSNNGLLDDSSPFALTQSFFQDTQQYVRELEDEIVSSQVKREPAPIESKPVVKMEIDLPLDEDLIEFIESSGEEKMQIDTRPRAASNGQKEQKSSSIDTSPIKRPNQSIYGSSVDDWVARKKPKTISDFFSAPSSRSGSSSSLQGLDTSAELKKSLTSDHSFDAVLASMTSSLKSSSSFSSREKFVTEPIQIDDDDFKPPSSRGISPVKMKSQSSGESTKSKSTPKKSSKATSQEQKGSSKKFKKQDKSSTRPVRQLDPDDDGNDLDDFK